MAGDEVTRGTTRDVKTLQAVNNTRAMPAASASRRAADSTASSFQIPGGRPAGPKASEGGESRGRRSLRHERCRYLHRARAQELAEPLGLRVEAKVRRHTPAQQPVHDEVHRAEIGQQVPAD